jgi:hypothetical protein
MGKEFKSLQFRKTTLTGVFRQSLLPMTKGTFAERAGAAINSTESSRSSPIQPENHTIDEYRAPVMVNVVGERVDQELPVSPEAEKEVRRARSKGQRLCNDFQLKGRCFEKSGCKYSHHKLPSEHRLALRKLLRDQPCNAGTRCRDQTCYYGHNCTCKLKNCRFSPRMHDIEKDTAQEFFGIQ